MIKDKTLRAVLFGTKAEFSYPKNRTQHMTIPAKETGDKFRFYEFGGDDGFILFLIKMIEKLEDRIISLESKKIK